MFPWKTEPPDFYYTEDETIDTTMGSFSHYDHDVFYSQHHILGSKNKLEALSASQFFYVLHHEAIHDLLCQMAIRYNEQQCTDEAYHDDAALQWLILKYRYSATYPIQSLYFNNCEEKLCYSNQDLAREKMRQLNPSRQLTCQP